MLNGVLFDNGTCTIKCDGVVTFDDAKAYNDYADEEEERIQKEMMNKAFKSIKKG